MHPVPASGARAAASVPGRVVAGAAAVTVALLVASCPGVLPWAPAGLLAWPALAPLLWLLFRLPARRAVTVAFAAGLAAQIGFTPWLPGLIARFWGTGAVPAAAVAIGLWGWAALAWAAWATVVRLAHPRVPATLLAPAALVAIERFWPAIFPQTLGLTQYRQPRVAQVAELGGPYVLTFLLALCAAALARAFAPGPRRARLAPLAVAGAAIAAALVFSSVRLASVEDVRARAPTLRVGVVQGGTVRRGWRPSPAEPGPTLARYQRLSAALEREGPLDLILWPEKAYPLLLRADARHDYPEAHAGRLRRGFASPLLFGASSVDARTRELSNSAALLLPDGTLRVAYDKVELIFWSERLPRWARPWAPGGVRYRPGTRLDPIHLGAYEARARLAVFICFEAAFPGHVRRLVARDADLLVNLSDDSWFGESSEPEQHLAHAVFRAIEARRDLVRAAGAGVSAHVTAAGRIAARTELSRDVATTTTLTVEPRLLAARSLHASLGDLFAAACALVSAAAFGAGAWAWAWARARRAGSRRGGAAVP